MRLYSIRIAMATACIAVLGVLLAPVAGATHANVNCDGVFDEFGYECSEVPLDWIEVTDEVVLEDRWAQIDLPFAFPYYGSTVDRFWLSGSYAYLTFEAPSEWATNTYGWLPQYMVPNSVISVLDTPQGQVALTPFWNAEQSSYRFEVVGSAPDRTAVLEFDLTGHLASSATAQVQLHENGDVDLLYAAAQTGDDDIQVLVGMEDWEGRVGGTIFHDRLGELATPSAFHLAYPADPPSFPVTGRDELVIEEGGSASFNVLDNDHSPDGLPLEVVDYGSLNYSTGEIEPSSQDFACEADGDCTLNLDPDGTSDFLLHYEVSNGTLSSLGEIYVDRVPADDGPPVAVLDVEQGNPDEISIVRLSAANSQVPDGAVLYEWDLKGDGAVDYATTGPHTYALYDGGAYSPTVTVIDAEGQSDTAGLAAPTTVGDVNGDAFAFGGGISNGTLPSSPSRSVEGPMTAGDLSITRDNYGITSVNGSATVSTTSGDHNVTINVNRLWILPIYFGSVTIPEAGYLGVRALVITQLIDGGDTVWGQSIYFTLGPFMNLDLNLGIWAVKDGT